MIAKVDFEKQSLGGPWSASQIQSQQIKILLNRPFSCLIHLPFEVRFFSCSIIFKNVFTHTNPCLITFCSLKYSIVLAKYSYVKVIFIFTAAIHLKVEYVKNASESYRLYKRCVSEYDITLTPGVGHAPKIRD